MKGNTDEAFILEQRKQLASTLKNLREAKGLSQDAFGELVGMNRTTVSKIEAGKWNMGIDTLILFASKLGVEVILGPPAP